MKTLAMAPALALAVCALASTTTPAVAAGKPAPARGTPPGYQIVESSGFTAPNGVQPRGSVFCPAGTVVWGGGAEIFGPDPNLNLNSSAPLVDGSGWTAAVNNIHSEFPFFNGWEAAQNDNTSFDTTFNVLAICGKAPATYSINFGPIVPAAPLSQSAASAICPIGHPLSGGVVTNTSSVTVDLNTSFEDGDWTAFEDVGFVQGVTLEAVVICA
jgi:hypothetical protein